MAGTDTKSPDEKAAADARRWKRELDLAKKRERDWFIKVEKIVKRYRGEEKKRNRWNILWSNTTLLRPFIYNSRAAPDVRRRFRDADPVGKAVSEVLERGLQIVVDDDETDEAIKTDVLDSLLGGRGVSRVRYIPTIVSVPPAPADDAATLPATTADAPEPAREDGDDEEAMDEELDYEQSVIDHVDWKDFRHGYGRIWAEVPWTAYRHKLSKSDAEKTLGAKNIKDIKFAEPDVEDDSSNRNVELATETQKVAEFWEIWDKLGGRVFFLHEKEDRIMYPVATPTGEPPIDFPGFFPSPKPLYVVEDTGSLLPIPLFDLYEEQANELDKLSRRIDRVVNAMKVRGVYDAKLGELTDLMDSDDNELIAVQNAQAWRDGGLDKAISWMPVEQAVEVLKGLYAARRECKAVIDEIIGVADILRGATDPDETLGAQQLKQMNGNARLQMMREAVRSYVKDLLRLCAVVQATKFSQKTFAEMTELNYPTMLQKIQAKQAYLASTQMQGSPPPGPVTQPGAIAPPQPQAPPQPPPPPPDILSLPSWEEIMEVMRNNTLRRFKVDVETDSTVAATIDSDMEGMSSVLKAVVETLQGLAPLVEAGALPIEAAKEIVLAVIRRARLGLAVEDAFEKLQMPQPKPQAADPKIEVAQIQAKSEIDKINAETAQFRQQETLRAHLDATKDSMEAQLQASDKAHNARLDAMSQQTERMMADAANQTKVIIALITAGQKSAAQASDQAHDARMKAADQAHEHAVVEHEAEVAPTVASFAETEGGRESPG
jgi:hypothetical protein